MTSRTVVAIVVVGACLTATVAQAEASDYLAREQAHQLAYRVGKRNAYLHNVYTWSVKSCFRDSRSVFYCKDQYFGYDDAPNYESCHITLHIAASGGYVRTRFAEGNCF